MNNENRELMEEVARKNLEVALDANTGSDEEKVAFSQAMVITERLITLSKNDDAYQEHVEKLAADREKLEIEKEKIEIEKEKIEIERIKLDNEKENRIKEDEFRKAESMKNWMYRIGETAVIGVVVPLVLNAIGNRYKMKFADKCMDWEVNGGNTFTTTPGRSIKDFFHFK